MSTECPERVAIETPRGNIRAGEVVECLPTTTGSQRILCVEVDGVTFRVHESDATPPTLS